MTDDTITQFSRELNSFFVIVLLNMAFGALAMAFGMQFIVTSVLGMTGGQGVAINILFGALSLVCFGLGLAWVVSSAKILKGITEVRRAYKIQNQPVSPEILTGWIVRIMAHYRENRTTIRWMALICALGGCAFLLLGLHSLVQGISGLAPSGVMAMQVLPFVAAGINLAIGVVSLRCSWYFRKYSTAWDRRLAEAARSEETLQKAMERR